MRKWVVLMVLLLAGACTVPGLVDAQTSSDSSTGVASSTAPSQSAQDPPSWLFPVAKLNDALPGEGEYAGKLVLWSGGVPFALGEPA